jgi:hypothetical protein
MLCITCAARHCEAADVGELLVTYPPKQSEKCTNSQVEIASATQILL